MQNLAFVLQAVSLSSFIVFAAIALFRHMKDEERLTERNRTIARIDLALRRTGTHPGNRVKTAKAIIEGVEQ